MSVAAITLWLKYADALSMIIYADALDRFRPAPDPVLPTECLPTSLVWGQSCPSLLIFHGLSASRFVCFIPPRPLTTTEYCLPACLKFLLKLRRKKGKSQGQKVAFRWHTRIRLPTDIICWAFSLIRILSILNELSMRFDMTEGIFGTKRHWRHARALAATFLISTFHWAAKFDLFWSASYRSRTPVTAATLFSLPRYTMILFQENSFRQLLRRLLAYMPHFSILRIFRAPPISHLFTLDRRCFHLYFTTIAPPRRVLYYALLGFDSDWCWDFQCSKVFCSFQ